MREDLIIYGAGGLGREACCLTQLLDRWNILGFVDDGKKPGEVIDGKEVLDLAQILRSRRTPLNIVIGFADPAAKGTLMGRLSGLSGKVRFPTLIAPDSYVVSRSHIGEGCIIGHFCTVSVDVTIGRGVLINSASQIGHDVVIGDFCTVMPSCNISGYVSIGIGSLVGAQSFILQGKKIGAGVTVGAGSKVFSDVRDNVTVFGCPAAVIHVKGASAPN